MNTFTVTLTDAELKALSHVVFDPQVWIDNAVHEQCRHAMEHVFANELQRMLADPSITEIPADKEAVVLAADIKTAKELSETSIVNMEDMR